MDIYEIRSVEELVDNPYPGRGIIVGKTPDGTRAVAAYFIMGRSENSRNRIFVSRDQGIYTEAFDPSKLEDPSLIIYAAVRTFENKLIVTNGDQTDTIYDGLAAGRNFYEALTARCFEPDPPNFTPRISAMLTFAENDFSYDMSILKSAGPEGNACNRFGYAYASTAGLGHFIHTYVTDGNPIPTFQGEPERMAMDDDMERFTERLWNGLDEANKISLYVRYTDLATGEFQDKIINKHN